MIESEKMKHVKKIFFFVLFFGLAFQQIKAQDTDIPDRPNPPKLVNNLSKQFPDFITQEQTQELENKLDRFSDSTSNQISIVIVDNLNGYEPYDFATRLGQKWGVGTKKFDNGVVILVKPSGGEGQKKAFIAVGYGLEGAIPDATSKEIVENEMIPNFKNGQNFVALDKATDVLISLAKGEINAKQYAQKAKSKDNSGLLFFGFWVVFCIFIFLRSASQKRTGGGSATLGSAGMFFLGSGFGGGFGGGGFGGGGGGGFGGFGGGGFGGGGAGGSW